MIKQRFKDILIGILLVIASIIYFVLIVLFGLDQANIKTDDLKTSIKNKIIKE